MLPLHETRSTPDVLLDLGRKLAKPVDGVAATIERALTATRPRARYQVGADVKVQAALSAVTPARVLDALNGRLTGTPGAKR